MSRLDVPQDLCASSTQYDELVNKLLHEKTETRIDRDTLIRLFSASNFAAEKLRQFPQWLTHIADQSVSPSCDYSGNFSAQLSGRLGH